MPGGRQDGGARGGRHRLDRCRRDPATDPTRTAPSPRDGAARDELDGRPRPAPTRSVRRARPAAWPARGPAAAHRRLVLGHRHCNAPSTRRARWSGPGTACGGRPPTSTALLGAVRRPRHATRTPPGGSTADFPAATRPAARDRRCRCRWAECCRPSSTSAPPGRRASTPTTRNSLAALAATAGNAVRATPASTRRPSAAAMAARRRARSPAACWPTPTIDVLLEVVARALRRPGRDGGPGPAHRRRPAARRPRPTGLGADDYRGYVFDPADSTLGQAIVAGAEHPRARHHEWSRPGLRQSHDYGPAMIAPLNDAQGSAGRRAARPRPGRPGVRAARRRRWRPRSPRRSRSRCELDDARADAEWLRVLEDRAPDRPGPATTTSCSGCSRPAIGPAEPGRAGARPGHAAARLQQLHRRPRRDDRRDPQPRLRAARRRPNTLAAANRASHASPRPRRTRDRGDDVTQPRRAE